MTIEEIRKNAPDGATHYWDYPATGLPIDYYKLIDGDLLSCWGGWLDNPEWIPLRKSKDIQLKPL